MAGDGWCRSSVEEMERGEYGWRKCGGNGEDCGKIAEIKRCFKRQKGGMRGRMHMVVIVFSIILEPE